MDTVTSIYKKAINVLFLGDPKRTALGALFGYVIFVITQIFAPSLKNLSFIEYDNSKVQYFIPLGIFLFHLPKWIFGKKLSDDMITALILIDDCVNRNNLTKAESSLYYKQLIENVLDKAANSAVNTNIDNKGLQGEIESKSKDI